MKNLTTAADKVAKPAIKKPASSMKSPRTGVRAGGCASWLGSEQNSTFYVM
jgi:hypothetical protein